MQLPAAAPMTKSEGRNPKAEGKPKPEFRRASPAKSLIFPQAARQHAAESPKLRLLGAAPRQPAKLKGRGPKSEGLRWAKPIRLRVYGFGFPSAKPTSGPLLSCSVFGFRPSDLYMGSWQTSNALALQASLCGSVTHRLHHFNRGENEIQARLISSASVGATPTPATNSREVSRLPVCKTGVTNKCRKRRLEHYQHLPPTKCKMQSAECRMRIDPGAGQNSALVTLHSAFERLP